MIQLSNKIEVLLYFSMKCLFLIIYLLSVRVIRRFTVCLYGRIRHSIHDSKHAPASDSSSPSSSKQQQRQQQQQQQQHNNTPFPKPPPSSGFASPISISSNTPSPSWGEDAELYQLSSLRSQIKQKTEDLQQQEQSLIPTIFPMEDTEGSSVPSSPQELVITTTALITNNNDYINRNIQDNSNIPPGSHDNQQDDSSASTHRH
ncbi:hypothetical protein BDA99DRAFT_540314 [Phascolomyces articulosus]|uniref:Uncharacterized protein n=1 Tax=Phascolomyces articulosus TaxID=60185 RepID=A0AAD5PBD5_9FUNG|nr:hypothetical protein BDA99DRAFT_540314 [Phascolomyces articulosus]